MNTKYFFTFSLLAIFSVTFGSDMTKIQLCSTEVEDAQVSYSLVKKSKKNYADKISTVNFVVPRENQDGKVSIFAYLNNENGTINESIQQEIGAVKKGIEQALASGSLNEFYLERTLENKISHFKLDIGNINCTFDLEIPNNEIIGGTVTTDTDSLKSTPVHLLEHSTNPLPNPANDITKKNIQKIGGVKPNQSKYTWKSFIVPVGCIIGLGVLVAYSHFLFQWVKK